MQVCRYAGNPLLPRRGWAVQNGELIRSYEKKDVDYLDTCAMSLKLVK